jgi:hypothetical protein
VALGPASTLGLLQSFGVTCGDLYPPIWSGEGTEKSMPTYVPGFWSWYGLSSTVRTLMMAVYVFQIMDFAIEAIGGD